MSDEISDDLKKINDTPRADSAYQHKGSYGIYQEARLLEKEMNQYKTHIEFQDKRIKELELELNEANEKIEEMKAAGNELATWTSSIYSTNHLLSLEQYRNMKRDIQQWEKAIQ